MPIMDQQLENGLKIEDHLPSLLTTFHHVPVLITVYLIVVKIVGPKMMRNREPFELKTVLRIYNLAQILVNCYIFYLISIYWGLGMLRFWPHICKPISGTIGYDYTNHLRMIQIMYYYYLTKIVDLLDTVFFVLRKKDSQMTFLHLFHHSTMIFSSWLTFVYFQEQVGSIFGTLNVVVHIFMYLYYFLSSFGPALEKYLWWKKHLTKLQLVQFMIILAVLLKMKYVNCQCSPLFWGVWTFNISTFICLFSHFYIKSYTRKEKMQ